MVRRSFVVLLLAAIAAYNYASKIIEGFDILRRAPAAEAATVTWTTNLDIWLLNHDIEPVLGALFVAVLLSGWIIPDVWPFIKRRYLKNSTGAFNETFRDLDFAEARKDFRVGMEQAYTRYCKRNNVKRTYKSLVQLIDAIRLPETFPPDENIPLPAYVNSTEWHPDTKQAMDFLRAIHESAHDAEKIDILFASDYRQLLSAYNTSAKFWDHVAREIIEGRLIPVSIRLQIDANMRDVMLLVVSQLVLSQIIPWAVGGGSKGLFLLAVYKSGLRREWPWRRY